MKSRFARLYLHQSPSRLLRVKTSSSCDGIYNLLQCLKITTKYLIIFARFYNYFEFSFVYILAIFESKSVDGVYVKFS